MILVRKSRSSSLPEANALSSAWTAPRSGRTSAKSLPPVYWNDMSAASNALRIILRTAVPWVWRGGLRRESRKGTASKRSPQSCCRCLTIRVSNQRTIFSGQTVAMAPSHHSAWVPTVGISSARWSNSSI